MGPIDGGRDLRRLPGATRGQTLQDYVLGVSVFLLTVSVVLGTALPTVLATFDDETGGDVDAQADRVAHQIVSNASGDGERNNLDVAVLERIVGMDERELRDRYRLPESSSVNLSVRSLDGERVVTSNSGVPLATDQRANGRETATTARVVTVSDDSCPVACRLVVEVW